jgi:hypothetical protein
MFLVCQVMRPHQMLSAFGCLWLPLAALAVAASSIVVWPLEVDLVCWEELQHALSALDFYCRCCPSCSSAFPLLSLPLLPQLSYCGGRLQPA